VSAPHGAAAATSAQPAAGEVSRGPAASGPLAQGLRSVLRRPGARVPLIVLALLYAAALLADFLAPYGMDQKHYRDPHFYKYHPPMRVRWIDDAGRFHARPFVYASRLEDLGGPRYAEDRSVRYPLRFFARGARYPVLFGLASWDRHLFGVDEPGRVFLLGADFFGRDILSRILFGARVSLSIGLIGIAITFVIGLALGGASGFFGGAVDDILMRFSEVVISLPVLYLIVALAGVLPADLPTHYRYLLIVVILSFVGWAPVSRVIRGMVLAIRENEFVQAARALGLPPSRIIWRHVLPATTSTVVVAATMSVPFYILGEVSLSFLGVGLQEPQASWGLMLNDAQNVTVLRHFPWLLAPGIFISIAVAAYNFLGDGLRDALDPRERSTLESAAE
jgi:peptide/nickel transport system permease protein